MQKRFGLAFLSLTSLLVLPGAARASGFETAKFGGEHGHVVTDNPTALYFNPSGLAESEGTHIWLEFDLALRGASYEHAKAPTDVAEPAGAEGANNGKGTLFNVAAVPMLGVSTKITKDLAAGLGFFIPFGGSETWDKNDKFTNNNKYPGIVDGPQRWYSMTGTILSLYFSGGVAYKIPGTGLSLGAAGNLIHSAISTIRARTPAGDDDIGSEGRSFLSVGGFQGSFAAGATFEAMPKMLWFGASYQSRPNVAGGMNLNGTLKTYFNQEQTEDVTVHQDLPDIIRWGARFAPTKELELRVSGDWERWSAFTAQCISKKGQPCGVKPDGSAADGTATIQNLPRGWHDGAGFHVGGSYWVKPEVELMLGAGYDSNAAPPEHLEPVLLDLKAVTIGGGGTFTISKNFRAGLSYTQFIFLPSDTTGLSVNAQPQPASRGPDAGGKYTSWIGLVNANVEVMF